MTQLAFDGSNPLDDIRLAYSSIPNWYALRIFHNRIEPLRQTLDVATIRYFYPHHLVEKCSDGGLDYVQEPIIKSLIFIRSTCELKKHHNTCPVMLSSSQQASLTGRFGNSEYGRSKKAGEDLFLEYGKETGAKVLVYRFPNLYGKWCRPNYNSAIATFCNNIANDLPIQVNDRSVQMEILYIDDLVEEMICALKGQEHHCEFEGLDVLPSAEGRYCYCPVTHKTTLGEIVDTIYECARAVRAVPDSAEGPSTALEMPQDGLRYRLMSTFLSYLPKEKAIFDLKMNVDPRGSFTELVHTLNCGQVSINISKPGITKGQHWHNSKWEQFIVVSGHGLIQMRKEGSDEVIEYEVSGDRIQSVIMLPGYTHNIINLSQTEDLVTVMYCNEVFNPERPDTYFDKVEK